MPAETLEERLGNLKASTPDALAQRLATMRDAGAQSTSLQVGGEMALRRFTDNMLNIPGGVGEALAIGGAGVRATAGAAGAKLMGRSGDFLDRFREARADERGRFPASGMIALGERMPQSTDIVAGFDVFSNLPDVVSRPRPETWRLGDPLLGPAMDEATLERIGFEASEGIHGVSGYFQHLQTERNGTLLQRYRERFGRWAPPLSSLSESMFEAIHVWAAAARQVRTTDPTPVADEMRHGRFEVPRGTIALDGRHHVEQPLHLATARGAPFGSMSDSDGAVRTGAARTRPGRRR